MRKEDSQSGTPAAGPQAAKELGERARAKAGNLRAHHGACAKVPWSVCCARSTAPGGRSWPRRWITVALAALCGAPLWLLERLFKKRFRKAPVAWLRRLKCRRAGGSPQGGAVSQGSGRPLGLWQRHRPRSPIQEGLRGVSPKRYAIGGHRGGGGVESDLDRATALLRNSIVLGLLSEDTRVMGLAGGRSRAPLPYFATRSALHCVCMVGLPASGSPSPLRLPGKERSRQPGANTAVKCPNLWLTPASGSCRGYRDSAAAG